MNKLKTMMIAVFALTCLSTSSFAGSFGLGVTGSFAMIDASGNETDTSTDVNNSTSVSNSVGIGSFFAEYNFDFPLTIGYDFIPGSADVAPSKLKRSEAELSVDADEVPPIGGNPVVDRSAQAEVENHTTWYAEYTVFNNFYVKGGYVEMDVNTTETLTSGIAYGNTSVDGMLYGIGYKNDFGNNGFYKVEVTQEEFDTLTLKSTGNLATGTTKTVKADLDVTRANFSLGYKF